MRKVLFILLLMIAGACTSTIEIDNFDKEAWKQDNLGCQGVRDQLSYPLFSQKEKLKEHHPRAIKKLLGSPNKTELYSRNQQFFIYYIGPGTQCGIDSLTREGAMIKIRFGALNQVNEVFVVE